jgi:hypothetical protein
MYQVYVEFKNHIARSKDRNCFFWLSFMARRKIYMAEHSYIQYSTLCITYYYKYIMHNIANKKLVDSIVSIKQQLEELVVHAIDQHSLPTPAPHHQSLGYALATSLLPSSCMSLLISSLPPQFFSLSPAHITKAIVPYLPSSSCVPLLHHSIFFSPVHIAKKINSNNETKNDMMLL